MYVRFWQTIDSIACLPAGLQNAVFAYVSKVSAESELYYLFTWRSKHVDLAYARKVLAVS